MALNIKRFLKAIGLVPNSSQQTSSAGEIEFRSDLGKLSVNDGTSADSVVQENKSATLTNKTLSDSTTVIADVADATKQIKFDAAGTTGTSTTLLSSQTTSKTLTLPDATDTLVGKATTDTLSNKTIDTASSNTIKVSGNTLSATAGTATVTIPNSTDTLVGRATTDTLSNKTIDTTSSNTIKISGNTLSATSGTATVTIPNSTDTLVGRNTTDTLTNKTIDTASSNTVKINGNSLSATAGTATVTIPNSTDTLVGRATTDSLTNKTFSDAVTGAQIATPSNPSAGFNKLYFKSDGNLYKLNSSGTEVQVGAGTGGSSTFTATAGENLSALDAVYIASSSDTGRTAGQAYRLNVTNDQRAEFIGFATAAATSGTTATIQISGTLAGFTGLTSGKPIFGSTTQVGGYQASAPALSGQYVVQLGEAISSTTVAINAAGSATAIRIVPNTVNTSAVNVVKNYVLNGDFESNSTNSWSLFNTTLTGVIPTGSIVAGAASITTFAATSSGKLAGGYSLNVAGSGAITANQGFISDAFTIDAEDQARVLGFSFYYQVLSGLTNLNLSGTSSNSFAVYIYDVTNSAWIQPAGVYNLVQGSGVGYANGTFQTTSNSTQYRIAVLCVNSTGVGGASMMFDDFVVGPQKVVSAPAMSDSSSWTPVIGGLTIGNGTITGSQRRDGDSIELRGNVTYGSTSSQSGSIFINVPSGITLNSAYNNFAVGSAYYYAAAGTQYAGTVWQFSTTQFVIVGQPAGYWNATNPAAPANGNNYAFQIKAVVSGWSSNAVSSADTDTRVISARLYLTSNFTLSSTGFSSDKITGFTQIFDDANAWNSTNSQYVIPVSGKYRVTFMPRALPASGTSTMKSYFKQNGTPIAINTQDGVNSSDGRSIPSTAVIKANAGDTLDFWIDKYAAVAGTVLSSVQDTTISIERLSGPAVVQATETVAARYTTTNTTTIPTVDTIFSPGTVDYDTHGAYSAGTGFTVPVSGKYLVHVNYVTSSYGTAGFLVAKIYKGATVMAASTTVTTTTSAQYAVSVTAIVNAKAGDILKGSYLTTAGTPALDGVVSDNFIEFIRLGN